MRKKCIIPSLLLTSAIMTLPGFNSYAFAESETQAKAIHVSGQGQVSVVPDIAYIQLGVQTQENSVVQAQAENAEAVQKIYDALEQEHVSKEDIQTVSFNVNPIYTWDQNKQVFQGYQVVHILRVKDRELERIGALLDHVTQTGANHIENIQYDTEKRQQYQLDALNLALDDAEQKAHYIAEKKGLANLSIIDIRESSGSNSFMYSAAQKSDVNSTATQISTGQITISANVEVSYTF